MHLTIRNAVPGDAHAIAAAHVAAWRVGYRGMVADAFLDSSALEIGRRTAWSDLAAGERPAGWDDQDQILVPVLDGAVVGFAHFGTVEGAVGSDYTPESGPSGELYGFYLHPDAWGTGVADELLQSCHDALAKRFGRASLWVLTDNGRARRFYERNGWSCGTGGRLVENLWAGPAMPGLPELDAPLAITQYRRTLP